LIPKRGGNNMDYSERCPESYSQEVCCAALTGEYQNLHQEGHCKVKGLRLIQSTSTTVVPIALRHDC